MFETKKTLIVVYKDELLMNQFKKMVETCDNNEQGVVGVRNDSVNIVSWTEKVWLGNKKAGNIQGKILFLGEIKGTDKLIPVIDVKFNECGVKFGWAGNQAVIYANLKALTTRESYDAFLDKLSALPVPSFLKAKKDIATTETDRRMDPEVPTENVSEHAPSENMETDEAKQKKANIIKSVKKAVATGTDAIEKAGNQAALKLEEFFRNKSLMKQQMLMYGTVSFYNEGFEKFMNM